jgi:hypothetical protein
VTGTLLEDVPAFLGASPTYFAQYLSERKMFRTQIIEKNEAHILCPNGLHFYCKSFGFRDNEAKGVLYHLVSRERPLVILITAL